MRKRHQEAILISYLQEKEKYQRLANFMVRLMVDDPGSPRESLHTLIYRLKDELRLIEKIDILNTKKNRQGHKITAKNYQAGIGDLLGVRIICLRLSDIGTIEAYLKLLVEEDIFRILKGPDQKRSFILPFQPDETQAAETAIPRYTGYSSIHYQLQLGENADVPAELKSLQVELQLRTILEEAWSEIDHKYRYVLSRTGQQLPEHIHAGFYNLSAYLQVAALQAESLCRSAEAYGRHPILLPAVGQTAGDDTMPMIDTLDKEPARAETEATLAALFGVTVTARTLIYIEKRLSEFNPTATTSESLRQIIKKNRLAKFTTIFQEILASKPFLKSTERSIDIVNALNFALFYELQGKRVAIEGLRGVLRWRKSR